MRHGVITVTLRDLRIFAHHGVGEQERIAGNDFIVNASVSYHSAGRIGDDITKAISYADLYEMIQRVMSRPCNLLETVCQGFADEVREKWPCIESGRMSITKLTPPIRGIDGNASVSYEF